MSIHSHCSSTSERLSHCEAVGVAADFNMLKFIFVFYFCFYFLFSSFFSSCLLAGLLALASLTHGSGSQLQNKQTKTNNKRHFFQTGRRCFGFISHRYKNKSINFVTVLLISALKTSDWPSAESQEIRFLWSIWLAPASANHSPRHRLQSFLVSINPTGRFLWDYEVTAWLTTSLLKALKQSDWLDLLGGRGECLGSLATAVNRRRQWRIPATVERTSELASKAAPLRKTVAV